MPGLADALLLARLQFAVTIAFHIIFPALTIGLASYLAFLEGASLITVATSTFASSGTGAGSSPAPSP